MFKIFATFIIGIALMIMVTLFISWYIGGTVNTAIKNSERPDTTITYHNGKYDTVIIQKSKTWYQQ